MSLSACCLPYYLHSYPADDGVHAWNSMFFIFSIYIIANIYLNFLQAKPSDTRKVEITRGKEDVAVAEFLRDLAYQVHDMLGVRMHRLAVGEWEIRFRLDSVGVANGAWRIVVMNPTGHTCTVHIFREVQDTNKHEVVYQSPLSVVGPLDGIPVAA